MSQFRCIHPITYPGGEALTYTFDAASRRETLVDPDAGTTTYSFDAASRLTTVANPFSATTTWQYDGFGRAATITLANGATTTYAYDDASRITGVRNTKSGGAVIADFQYTRDNVGNPTAVHSPKLPRPVDHLQHPARCGHRLAGILGKPRLSRT